MMEVFVYDAKRITPELHQKRLANIMDAKVHCENFVKSMQLNPKQFGDYSHRLHEIKAPTLVVWGRDDRFVPLEVGLRLIAGISHAHMHIFNQCGHWVQWEHADAFNRLVHDFMTH